jgi:hypothetical protein
MKHLFKKCLMPLRPVMKMMLSVFFNRRYLSGRHFDADSFAGYVWGFRAIWQRNILRLGPPHQFPVGLSCTISNATNLDFHPDDLNNFQSPGTYIQNFSGFITFGRGCYIGPNVGIITANHDPVDPEFHLAGKNVVIGDKCWVGMNSVILPGVVLGPGTTVGAGSVVTRSFPDGNCIITGSPAQLLPHTNKTRQGAA